MNDLTRFFWQLCLLRRTPGDLPRSPWLLQWLLLLNLLINTLLGVPVFGPGASLLAALVELLLSAGLLFAALQVRGRAERWLQSYAALLGAGVVLGGIALVYRNLLGLAGVEMAALPDLMLFVWSIVVMAHVLRHALDIGLAASVLIVLAYTMFLFGLIAQWFAPELAANPT